MAEEQGQDWGEVSEVLTLGRKCEGAPKKPINKISNI